MDPNVISDQPQLSGGQRRPSENGADHLRRLKAHAGAESNSLASSEGEPAPAQETRPPSPERRRSLRYQCSGSVEIRTEDSQAPLWGTLVDISLHGCYVEMPATFPLDTVVTLKIESLGVRFSTLATVRATYPSLGMGMCFTDTQLAQQRSLEVLLRTLASQKPHRMGVSAGKSKSG